MTLSEIRTKVRDEIKDSTTTFFSDAQINAYINKALSALADVARLEADWTTDLVANQANYDLPTNALVIETVKVDADDDDDYTVYNPVKHRDVLEGKISGSAWYIRGGSIYLVDTPTAAVTDGLIMYGIKVADTLSSDSASHEYGTKYDWAIVYYAVKMCYQKRESWDKVSVYNNLYQEERDTLIEDRDAEVDGGMTPITGKWKM